MNIIMASLVVIRRNKYGNDVGRIDMVVVIWGKFRLIIIPIVLSTCRNNLVRDHPHNMFYVGIAKSFNNLCQHNFERTIDIMKTSAKF